LGIGSAETVFSLKLLHQNYINLFFYHTNIDTNDLHLQYMAIDSSGSIVSERRLIESAVLSSNRFNQFEGFISETGEFNVIMSSNITPASSWQTVHSRFTPNYNMSGLFNDTFINAIYNHIILDKPSIYIDVLPINDGTSFLLFSTIDNDSRSIKYVEGGKFGVLIFNYTDQYFGILQSSGLAGEEHVVSFAGGMSQTHVGLVPLIDYYIQNDGTITDFETPIKIGRSISDTEILLK
jgi:putative NIF3 family GTP cyclohydrolase 1 type 2